MTRDPVEDSDSVSEWLRRDTPPWSDADRAAMRSGVWREIEAQSAAEGAMRPRRPAFVFAFAFVGPAVLAAVLFAVVWRRPSAGFAVAPASAAVVPRPATDTTDTTDVTETTAAPVPTKEEAVPRAAGPVRPHARPRGREFEAVPVRIEFQTANPGVRIIWLVKKGDARSLSPSRHQEVS